MHSALCPGDGHAPQAGALRAAAAAILRATHLLVAAGAGMSADSGLATYDAIADVRCYHDRGLSYADLCCPRLLETDPALAYGFWGSCLHSYRAAAPHAGSGGALRRRGSAGAGGQARWGARGGGVLRESIPEVLLRCTVRVAGREVAAGGADRPQEEQTH